MYTGARLAAYARFDIMCCPPGGPARFHSDFVARNPQLPPTGTDPLQDEVAECPLPSDRSKALVVLVWYGYQTSSHTGRLVAARSRRAPRQCQVRGSIQPVSTLRTGARFPSSINSARSLSLHSLAVPRSQDTSSSTLRHRVLARSRSRALPATPRPGSSLSLSCTLTSSHPNRGQQRATQALHVVTPTTAFISSLTRQAACAHAISCRLALRMMMDGCVLCTRAVSCECVSHTQELMHASHARTHARTHARRADTQERQTATELSA